MLGEPDGERQRYVPPASVIYTPGSIKVPEVGSGFGGGKEGAAGSLWLRAARRPLS